MDSILEKWNLQKTYNNVVAATGAAWGWVKSVMWPVYSAAIVISIFRIIAVASQRQVMADHYYGSSTGGAFDNSDSDELVKEGKKFYNEELALSIKASVWAEGESAFKREHAARHGNQ